MTEYKVTLRPHPIHWSQRDDLAALWDSGLTIILPSKSAARAESRALAALPWKLCTLFDVAVTPC